MTQDVDMGRKVRNPRAVDALDAMLRQALDEGKRWPQRPENP
jgi:hypothetical protein